MSTPSAFLAAISAACRFALAAALTLAMLVPHTAGAAMEHQPIMTMSAATDAPMHGNSENGHGVSGGFACVVVCFGAPASSGPLSPIPVMRVTSAQYPVVLPRSHDVATPDPALRPPDGLRTA